MCTMRTNESTEGINMKIKWTPVETVCSYVRTPAPAVDSDLAVKGIGPGIGTRTLEEQQTIWGVLGLKGTREASGI